LSSKEEGFSSIKEQTDCYYLDGMLAEKQLKLRILNKKSRENQETF